MSVRKDILSKKSPCWVIDFKDEHGLRHRKRVHCTRSVANRKYLKILEEIENRKLGITSKHDQLSLKEFIKKYLITSEIDGKSPLTINRIRNATDAFSRLIGLNKPVSSIDALSVEEFKRIRLTEYTRKKTRLTKGALNTELKHLRALFNWGLKMDLISTSPFKNIQLIKTEPKPIRFLTPDELQSLFKVINESGNRNAFDLFTFYLQLGARRSEILPPKCTWSHIDFHRKTISITGKRQKKGTMPLNDTLMSILLNRRKDKYPFYLTPNQVTNIVYKYYRLAGIKDANVHTLRKTCGSLLIHAGIDIYRVSKWLRHSTVVITERHYVDLLRSEYDDISNILGQNASEYVDSGSNKSPILPNRPLTINGKGHNGSMKVIKSVI